MDYNTLRDEILSGPLAKQLAEFVVSGADNAIAEILNETTESVIGSVPMNEVLLWIAKNGVKPRLIGAVAAGKATGAKADAQRLGVVADSALDLILSPHVSALDLSNADVQMMLGALTQVGVISQTESAELVSAATRPASRAEVLFGQTVSDRDVAEALKDQKRALGEDEPSDYTLLRSDAIRRAVETTRRV